jgi:hypothetical protein
MNHIWEFVIRRLQRMPDTEKAEDTCEASQLSTRILKSDDVFFGRG